MRALLIKSGVVAQAIVVTSIADFQADAPSFCAMFDAMIESELVAGAPDVGWTLSQWQGAWNSAKAYAINDVVSDQGALWIALSSNTAAEPISNADWAPFQATNLTPPVTPPPS